jgi:hypothetical protein
MMFRGCSYEREVMQALSAGHWPNSCGAELHAHVEGCASCRDLVLVTQTFQAARSESVQARPVESGSLLWWRAQLRRRNAAAKSISRPITIAQIFAWGITVVAAVIFVASQYHHGLNWASWWAELTPARALHFAPANADKPDWNLLLLIPGIGTLALVGGLLVYLASEKS